MAHASLRSVFLQSSLLSCFNELQNKERVNFIQKVEGEDHYQTELQAYRLRATIRSMCDTQVMVYCVLSDSHCDTLNTICGASK